MPVIAKCQDCGKQYRLRDDLAGSYLPCKACGAEFRVPAPQSARRSSPGGQPIHLEDDGFDWDEPSAGQSSSMMYWLIGGAAVAVVLIGVLVGILAFSGDKQAENADKIAENDAGDPDNLPPGGNAPRINRPPVNNLSNRNRNKPPNRNRNKAPVQNNNKPIAQNPGGLKPAVNPNPGPGVGIPGGLTPPKANPKPGGLVKNNDGQKSIPNTTAANWTVKPDPPAVPIVFADNKRLVVNSPIRASGDAIYPSSNSAFVAIGSNRDPKRNFRVVQDLRTNTKVGEIRGFKLFFSKGVLSPDGAYFAAFDREVKAIVLYDVKLGKRLGTLPVDEKSKNRLKLRILDFAGPKRLVAAGDKSPLWVWNLPDANDGKSIILPENVPNESITFSPGGKYMALFSTANSMATVHVIDLTTGDTAGSVSMPKETGSWGCCGLSFSPDGKELAGLFKVSSSHRLYCWDVSNGRLAVSHQFEKDLKGISRNYRGPALQWFPEMDRWLAHGNVILDRDSGKPVWTLPKLPGSTYDSEARLLGSERVALIGRQGVVIALATMPLSKDEIDKATKIVRSGGSAADAQLPPLSMPDITAVKLVAIDGVAPNWNVTPDPAPQPAGKLLAASMQVNAGIGRLNAVAVSRADAAKAVVASENLTATKPDPNGGKPKTPQLRLERYDVAAGGKFLDAYDIMYKSTLLAVSPSGNRAAVRFKTGDDRIDIFALDKKNVAGFRPYTNEKSNHHRRITSAIFIDEQHLLTESSNRKVVLWKLPECKAVYVIEKAPRFTVSPGGKYLAVAATNSCRFSHAATGESAGDLQVGFTPQRIAIHANGRRIAVTFIDGNGSQLGIYNLRDGKQESTFSIPFSDSTLAWTGDNHVLIDNRLLLDLTAKSIVWSYQLTGGLHAPISPDGRHWYLAGTRPVTLNAVELPDPATLQRLAGKDLSPKMILKPGMKISLNVQLNGISGEPNLTNEIVRDWTKKLKQRGITVAAGQPITLFAVASFANTGKSVEFGPSRFGFGGRFGRNGARRGNETVAQTEIKCRIVVGFNNKAYAERKRTVANVSTGGYFGTRVSLRKDETVTAHLQTRQMKSATSFFRSYYPPSSIFAPEASNGLGTSQLTTGGARPLGN